MCTDILPFLSSDAMCHLPLSSSFACQRDQNTFCSSLMGGNVEDQCTTVFQFCNYLLQELRGNIRVHCRVRPMLTFDRRLVSDGMSVASGTARSSVG